MQSAIVLDLKGTLPLPLAGKKHFTVGGGPYVSRPASMVGVKMAREINLPCDIDVPTRDFSIPNTLQAEAGLIRAIDCILAGKPVYVGCWGGIGRTGLFLALLAKSFGVKDPVAHVREHYNSHAVETAEQKDFVHYFVIPQSVKSKIFRAKLLSWFSFRENLTKGL